MRKILIIAVIVVAAATARVFAGAGTSGGQFLKICVDAQAAALGGASSVCSGARSIFLNPAGAASVQNREIHFSQISWLEGINYSNISYAFRHQRSVMALGVNYLTVPSITKFDNLGNELSGSYAPADMALNIAYARNCSEIFTVESIDFGCNLKYVSSTLDDKTATALAVDAGIQKKFVAQKLQLGLALQNLGTEMKYNKEGDPLPLNFKLGGKYVLPVGSATDETLALKNGFTFLLDLNYMNDSGFFSNAGTEYGRKIGDMAAAARLGYNTNLKGMDGVSGVSAGFGITYTGYTLDYAIAPYGDLGLTHRISLSFKF